MRDLEKICLGELEDISITLAELSKLVEVLNEDYLTDKYNIHQYLVNIIWIVISDLNEELEQFITDIFEEINARKQSGGVGDG